MTPSKHSFIWVHCCSSLESFIDHHSKCVLDFDWQDDRTSCWRSERASHVSPSPSWSPSPSATLRITPGGLPGNAVRRSSKCMAYPWPFPVNGLLFQRCLTRDVPQVMVTAGRGPVNTEDSARHLFVKVCSFVTIFLVSLHVSGP